MCPGQRGSAERALARLVARFAGGCAAVPDLLGEHQAGVPRVGHLLQERVRGPAREDLVLAAFPGEDRPRPPERLARIVIEQTPRRSGALLAVAVEAEPVPEVPGLQLG